MLSLKKNICILLLILSTCLMSQNPSEEIINAELSFSDMCGREGLYKSFTTYLLPDCIVFRPGPKKAKDVYKPEMSSTGLTWKPIFVDVSVSGDFGYDTGPWKFTKDTLRAFGHFISVWEKQQDGKWRVIFDAGISHPDIDYDKWKVPDPTANSIVKNSIPKAKSEEEKLLQLDSSIGMIAEQKNINNAIAAYSSPDVRIYREGFLPAIGLHEGKKILSDKKASWRSEYVRMSSAGDLGYTYGKGKFTESNPDSEFAYMRIWKKDNDKWKIVLDLLSPIN